MQSTKKEGRPLQIVVNGQAEEVLSECTLFQLLEDKAVILKAAVIELNGKILKQEQWQSTTIHANDSLEILVFLGGG